MTTSEDHQQLAAFAMDLASRVAIRLEHHRSLAALGAEDIEQELIVYVLERAPQYDPAKGNIEAFTTRLMQSAVASLIRDSNRRRSNPPAGCGIDSLSKMVEGPDRKSAELNKGLTHTDGNRRRQIESRDPLRDLELADAIERQIQTLPANCRRIARLLRTSNQKEIAAKLGWSKRRVSQVLSTIREHFSNVDWSDAGFTRDNASPNCIANPGEKPILQIDQQTCMERTA